MTPPITIAVAASLLAVAVACPVARADEDELRLSVELQAGLSTVAAFETKGETQQLGGGLAVRKGLRNWLDLGVSARVLSRTAVTIPGGVIDGMGGADDLNVITDVHTLDLGVSARSYLELGPFLRYRPFVGLRLGAQAAYLGRPALHFSDGRVLAEGDSQWAFGLAPGVELGTAMRLSDAFAGALVLRGDRSSTTATLAASLEVSWLSY